MYVYVFVCNCCFQLHFHQIAWLFCDLDDATPIRFSKQGQNDLIGACISKVLSLELHTFFNLEVWYILLFFLSTAQYLANCQNLSCLFMLMKRIGFGLLLGIHWKQELANLHPYTEYVSDLKKLPSRQFSSSNASTLCAVLLEIPTRCWSLRMGFMQCKPFGCQSAVPAPLSKVSLIK